MSADEHGYGLRRADSNSSLASVLDRKWSTRPAFGALKLDMSFEAPGPKDKKSAGKIHVMVKEGNGLEASDNYIKLYLSKDGKNVKGTKQKTKPQKQTQDPIFEERFTYVLPKKTSLDDANRLQITAWDHAGRLASNECMGGMSFSFEELARSPRTFGWFQMLSEADGRLRNQPIQSPEDSFSMSRSDSTSSLSRKRRGIGSLRKGLKNKLGGKKKDKAGAEAAAEPSFDHDFPAPDTDDFEQLEDAFASRFGGMISSSVAHDDDDDEDEDEDNDHGMGSSPRLQKTPSAQMSTSVLPDNEEADDVPSFDPASAEGDAIPSFNPESYDGEGDTFDGGGDDDDDDFGALRAQIASATADEPEEAPAPASARGSAKTRTEARKEQRAQERLEKERRAQEAKKAEEAEELRRAQLERERELERERQREREAADKAMRAEEEARRREEEEQAAERKRKAEAERRQPEQAPPPAAQPATPSGGGTLRRSGSLTSLSSVASALIISNAKVQGSLEFKLGFEPAGGSSKINGTISVVVVRGDNLLAKQPYVKLYLSQDGKDIKSTKQKTKVCRAANGAVAFNETFVFYIPSTLRLDDSTRLQITLWDHARMRSNECYGGMSFSTADLAVMGTMDGNYMLLPYHDGRTAHLLADDLPPEARASIEAKQKQPKSGGRLAAAKERRKSKTLPTPGGKKQLPPPPGKASTHEPPEPVAAAAPAPTSAAARSMPMEDDSEPGPSDIVVKTARAVIATGDDEEEEEEMGDSQTPQGEGAKPAAAPSNGSGDRWASTHDDDDEEGEREKADTAAAGTGQTSAGGGAATDGGGGGGLKRADSLTSLTSVASAMIVSNKNVKGILHLVMTLTPVSGRSDGARSQIEVQVKRCRDFGAKQPYIKLYLSKDGKDIKTTKQKTKVQRAPEGSAEFNETLIMPVPPTLGGGPQSRLQITVWDHARIRANECFGGLSFSLDDLAATTTLDGWFHLLPYKEGRTKYVESSETILGAGIHLPREDLANSTTNISTRSDASSTNASPSASPATRRASAAAGASGSAAAGGGSRASGSGLRRADSLTSLVSVASANIISSKEVTGMLYLDLRYEPSDAGGKMLGTLHVHVKAGRGLSTKQPYVKLYLSKEGKDIKTTKQKTKTHGRGKGANPSFDERLVFYIMSNTPLEDYCRLQITVWDHARLRANECFGGMSFSLEDLASTTNFAGWFRLLPYHEGRTAFDIVEETLDDDPDATGPPASATLSSRAARRAARNQAAAAPSSTTGAPSDSGAADAMPPMPMGGSSASMDDFDGGKGGKDRRRVPLLGKKAQRHVEDLEQQLSEVNQREEHHFTHIREQSERIEALESELAQLRGEQDDTQKELRTLRQAKNDLEEEVRRLTALANAHEEDANARRNDLFVSRDKNEDLKDENRGLRAYIDQLIQELMKLDIKAVHRASTQIEYAPGM